VRIVSLCPSITESLVALGLAKNLAGVTRYCIHPHEALAGIPRVGGTKNPDLAAIRALRPDLVFCNSEENRSEDIGALKRAFNVDVSHPRTVVEIPALLRHFGRLTGTEERAQEISMKVEKALERVEDEARQRASSMSGESGVPGSSGAGAPPAPFRFIYLIWKDPWMTVGPRTYIADLLRRVGGFLSLEESSDAGASDYPVITEDAIVAARPDVLILPDEPYRFRERDASFWRGRLPNTTRVVLVSGDDFCWHGTRTLRGLEAARRLRNGSR
jgi:ABC-type Fe3+-hydroxamate transport system substrate-binding protein